MSRIRSIHPGLWTDESFVCLSPMARLLFIGLWNECDDGGCFEWKPMRIKMRILPADNIDAASILDELVKAECIMRYDIDGKTYGAVRNFSKFQKPKKPNLFCPRTEEVTNWCGTAMPSTPSSSPPVPHQFPTNGENAIQKGGREEGRKGSKKGSGARSDEKSYAVCGKVIKLTQEDFDKWQSTFHAIPDLRAELMLLDDYYSGKDPKAGKDWFHRTSSNLNRKHQERMVENAKPEGQAKRKDFSDPSTYLDYMIREQEQRKAWEAQQAAKGG